MNPVRVLRLLRIIRTVSDLAKSVDFYCHALGFTVARKADLDPDQLAALTGNKGICGQSATLMLGKQMLELIAFQPQGKSCPLDTDSTDLGFQHIAIVVSDIGAAYKNLCEYDFTSISLSGPQRLPPNTGSVTAFKFRDPDGHPIELIQFVSGTGDSVWQQQSGLFLGIDHSAISIADRKQSMDFYSRILGLHSGMATVNWGPAQEKLDNVPDVLVNVVALDPIEPTPHLELLDYRHRSRNPVAGNINIQDLVADCLVFEVQNLSCLLQRLDVENIVYISGNHLSGLAGLKAAALMHDPDGHLLLFGSAVE